MGKPANLEINFPDYCSRCTKGDYEFETSEYFMHNVKTEIYKLVCVYSTVCDLWAEKLEGGSQNED